MRFILYACDHYSKTTCLGSDSDPGSSRENMFDNLNNLFQHRLKLLYVFYNFKVITACAKSISLESPKLSVSLTAYYSPGVFHRKDLDTATVSNNLSPPNQSQQTPNLFLTDENPKKSLSPATPAPNNLSPAPNQSQQTPNLFSFLKYRTPRSHFKMSCRKDWASAVKRYNG